MYPIHNTANIMATDTSTHASEKDDSLIQYPCAFPIKIMGVHGVALQDAVVEIAKQHDPKFDANTMELRESSGGKYMGITVTIEATSRAQLDTIYSAFTAHPLVKVVL